MTDPPRMGRYRLVEKIAVGGMADLYLARADSGSEGERPVVVKRARRHLASDADTSEAFEDEARLATQLRHPAIVQVIEAGTEDGVPWIAMEFVEGRDLRQVLSALKKRRRVVSPVMAAWLCRSVLEGLHYAHERKGDDGIPLGIVHGDVSPENVLVGFDGSVKVGDFGVARARGRRARRGLIQGRYEYASPEQLRGDAIDRRTDIYAVGGLLYELMTGTPHETKPTDPNSPASSAVSERTVHSGIPGVPSPLVQIVERALQPAPEARFATAADMVEALDRFLIDCGVSLGPRETAVLMAYLFANEPAAAMPRRGTEVLPRAEIARVEALTTSASQPYRRQRRPWLLAAVAVAVVIATSIWALRPHPGRVEPVADSPRGEPAQDSQSRTAATASAPVAVSQSPATPPAGDRAGRSSIKPTPERGTGRLDVRVIPWAEVWLDGHRVGVTPFEPIETTSGSHSLVLRNRELSKEKRITVVVTSGALTIVKQNLLDTRKH